MLNIFSDKGKESKNYSKIPSHPNKIGKHQEIEDVHSKRKKKKQDKNPNNKNKQQLI
jgi:hypothetical protein